MNSGCPSSMDARFFLGYEDTDVSPRESTDVPPERVHKFTCACTKLLPRVRGNS